MSCTPKVPCGPVLDELGVVPPPPGLPLLHRRVGDYWSFLGGVIRETEQTPTPEGPLGRLWDIEGDPRGLLLAKLWAYVAEGVAATSEFTAGEAFVGTAFDWTDLRRIGALLGFRPTPPIAATGWVRVETDHGVDVVVPAATQVQAPALPPDRPQSQLFETIATTPLYADWAELTATVPPERAVPNAREVRFLVDPDFAAGDLVLFIDEALTLTGTYKLFTEFLRWYGEFAFMPVFGSLMTALAVAKVVGRRSELGTTVIEFDRDLGKILKDEWGTYAAYKIRHTAGAARPLEKAGEVTGAQASRVFNTVPITPALARPLSGQSIVLDATFDDVSKEQIVAIVNWEDTGSPAHVDTIAKHEFAEFEVGPGTKARLSKLTFKNTTPSPAATVYIVDQRVPAAHYRFPTSDTTDPKATPPSRLRLFPGPANIPNRIAVALNFAGKTRWEMFRCTPSAKQEEPDPLHPELLRGLNVDVLDPWPAKAFLDRAPTTANLVEVRHGRSSSAVLGSGNVTIEGQLFEVLEAPIAADVDAATASVRSSLAVGVDAARWDEVPSLYGVGDRKVYRSRLAFDGGVAVQFRRRLPTGRDNLTASYRVGGGLAGEVEDAAIDTLVGSVRGVKKVAGVGGTSGGADRTDERGLRRLAPRRSLAFDRLVSRADAESLALAFPGVSHAVAWRGADGTGASDTGLHLAFLRTTAAGVDQPSADDITKLRSWLDARRDTTVPLAIAAATVSRLDLTLQVVFDAQRERALVEAAIIAALEDPRGPLAPDQRALGQALDHSDIVAVVQAIPGVIGIDAWSLATTSLVPVTAAQALLGRRPAERSELLVLAPKPIKLTPQ